MFHAIRSMQVKHYYVALLTVIQQTPLFNLHAKAFEHTLPKADTHVSAARLRVPCEWAAPSLCTQKLREHARDVQVQAQI